LYLLLNIDFPGTLGIVERFFIILQYAEFIVILLEFSRVGGVGNGGFSPGSDHVGRGRMASLPMWVTATEKKWFGGFWGF
jgi:hypothetical protein